ncbi:MAG: type II toxin-antitoxin system RelE family toxin [Bacillota bacterium]|nr:type II toxin-antitoxin system RelE/ParE family toxin [Bacillota bacterium]
MKKYDIQLSKGAVRDLKKMEPALRDFMYNRISEIGEDPYKNENLSGYFKELQSQHSKFRGVEYRAVYYVNEEGKLVVIAIVGTRENIYKELARRL